jgi:hypothetical protein
MIVPTPTFSMQLVLELLLPTQIRQGTVLISIFSRSNQRVNCGANMDWKFGPRSHDVGQIGRILSEIRQAGRQDNVLASGILRRLIT